MLTERSDAQIALQDYHRKTSPPATPRVFFGDPGLAGTTDEPNRACAASDWRGGDAYGLLYLDAISRRSEHVWEIASRYKSP